jgi:hypothetical protein
MHRSKMHRYSITSSAVASSVGGTVTPIARAVARLMMSSNLVARATERPHHCRAAEQFNELAPPHVLPSTRGLHPTTPWMEISLSDVMNEGLAVPRRM